ncbi:sensor histidine kinase, partial [Rhizobium sp. KAs_5_22]
LALLVIDMAIVYAIQNYFYSSAKQYLVSKLNAVTSILSMHSQDSSANFSSEMRNMLETFNEKDKIELMAVNSKGRVVLTSPGFSPDAGMARFG